MARLFSWQGIRLLFLATGGSEGTGTGTGLCQHNACLAMAMDVSGSRAVCHQQFRHSPLGMSSAVGQHCMTFLAEGTLRAGRLVFPPSADDRESPSPTMTTGRTHVGGEHRAGDFNLCRGLLDTVCTYVHCTHTLRMYTPYIVCMLVVEAFLVCSIIIIIISGCVSVARDAPAVPGEACNER